MKKDDLRHANRTAEENVGNLFGFTMTRQQSTVYRSRIVAIRMLAGKEHPRYFRIGVWRHNRLG